MHLLEPRPQPSQLMRWTAPLIAIVATLLVGSGLFLALGKDPLQSFKVFFVEPLTSSYGWSELLIKACPLILIAQGLAIGFKARIYNIGAEGQLIAGALAGGGIALEEIERQIYDAAVARTDGNLSAAARLLGISRAQLSYRLTAKRDPA